MILNDVRAFQMASRDRMDELRKTCQGHFVILGENADIGWWSGYAKLPVKPTQKIFVAKGSQDVRRSAMTSFDTQSQHLQAVRDEHAG